MIGNNYGLIFKRAFNDGVCGEDIIQDLSDSLLRYIPQYIRFNDYFFRMGYEIWLKLGKPKDLLGIKVRVNKIDQSHCVEFYKEQTMREVKPVDDHPYCFLTMPRHADNTQTALYKALLNNLYGAPKSILPDIKKVIYNEPATIVLWADGTKTVVKADGEAYDPEKGLAMAISRKALGNKGNYYDTFIIHLPLSYLEKVEEEKKQAEEHLCMNCKYANFEPWDEVCSCCNHHSNWEPQGEIEKAFERLSNGVSSACEKLKYISKAFANEEAEHNCHNCGHGRDHGYNPLAPGGPCRDCKVSGNNKPTNWISEEEEPEERYCNTCMYEQIASFKEPCRSCCMVEGHPSWTPKADDQK